MRRILLLLCVAFFIFPAMAQNTLTIHQKDGQQFNFGFDDKPVITYTDTYLVLKTTKTEVQYPLASLSKFAFTDVADAIIPIKQDGDAAQMELDGYTVCITGAKARINVLVMGPDGKTVGTYKTDSDGSVTFSIADLPQGLYIINSENLTCKILKK